MNLGTGASPTHKYTVHSVERLKKNREWAAILTLVNEHFSLAKLNLNVTRTILVDRLVTIGDISDGLDFSIGSIETNP